MALPVATAPPAGAFPDEFDSCSFDGLQFFFSGGGLAWYGAGYDYRDNWLDGAAQWSNVRTRTGGAPYTSGLGNRDVVYRTDLGQSSSGGDIHGRADCYAGDVAFWLDNQPSEAQATRIAAHEAGHGHGFEHTGRWDGVGLPPVMATCLNYMSTKKTLGSDDHSYGVHKKEPTVTPNASFENGTSYWYTASAAISAGSGGGAPGEGDRYISVLAEGSQPHSVYATARHWDQHDQAATFRARANYKDGDAAVSGTITIALRAKRVGAGSSPGCSYINNWDLNEVDDTSWGMQTVKSTTVSVGDNWQFNSSFPAWTAPTGWEGADVRVQVYKNTNGRLYLDMVRAYQV